MESVNTSHIAIGTLFESARMKIALDAASRSHLKDCDLCRSRLSWMATAAGLGTMELEYEPPQAVLSTVLQIGRGEGLLKQVRKFIVASLTSDSFNTLAPVGVRRAETASRQITYEAGDLEIAILVQPSQGQTVTLTGQVLHKDGHPLEDKSGKVDLVVEGDHVAAASLSPWGEFAFSEMPQAAYSVQLFLADRVVRIPALPE